MKEAGVGWARKKAAKAGFSILTAGLIIVEILFETWGLKLEPERSYGLLRYTSSEPSSGPPMMALGNAVPIPVDSSAVTYAFESILLLSLVWTKIHLETNHDKGS